MINWEPSARRTIEPRNTTTTLPSASKERRSFAAAGNSSIPGPPQEQRQHLTRYNTGQAKASCQAGRRRKNSSERGKPISFRIEKLFLLLYANTTDLSKKLDSVFRLLLLSSIQKPEIRSHNTEPQKPRLGNRGGQAGRKEARTARKGLDEVDEGERLDGLHLLVAHVHQVRNLGLLGGPLEHLLLCSRQERGEEESEECRGGVWGVVRGASDISKTTRFDSPRTSKRDRRGQRGQTVSCGGIRLNRESNVPKYSERN